MLEIFLSLCACIDLRFGKIPNRFLLLNMFLLPLGCLLNAVAGGGNIAVLLINMLLKYAFYSVIALGLHKLRICGGGDLKVLALCGSLLKPMEFGLFLAGMIVFAAIFGCMRLFLLGEHKLPLMVPCYWSYLWIRLLGFVGGN